MSWCPRQFVSPCWSIRQTLQRPPRPRCATYRKRQALSDCKFKCLRPALAGEIEAAFATLGREPADALFVARDGFFISRRVQFAVLAMRHAIPIAHSGREYPEAGGLMSYGTDNADRFRQVGVMSGQVLKGAKPADLPVLQSSEFEFVINLQATKAPVSKCPNAAALADEMIE